jgi:hypothetical protein
MILAQISGAQGNRKSKEKGPRALGLLELAPDGKARLIPIAIMVGGKFYDASAYKASPVPLALWSETVYEAESNGVSQGLFTVGGAARAGTNWFAEGKWQPAGSAPAKTRHSDTKPVLDNDEGPPKLRRPEAQKGQTPEAPPRAEPPTAAPPKPEPPASDTTATAPTTETKAASPAPQEDSKETASAANDTDPNRPVLHRGKAETLGSTQRTAQVSAKGGSTTPAAKAGDKKPADKKATQLIPAISDAGGPDPRPYAYDIKPDEDQKFRTKMLSMAAELIRARAKELSPAPPAAKSVARPTVSNRAAKAPQPTFADIQFRAFDLWNTNEPVFVLSAKAQMPKSVAKSPEPALDLTYFVTLVVKADIYGDLRKLEANITDDHHLDQIPRLELIDAVDADGDGRGEFLFRQVSDGGSTWAVYRAGADQLFALFQGTLSSSKSEPPE